MSADNIRKVIADMQLKITEHAVKEAELKVQKAEVELETSKLHQEYIRNLIKKEQDESIIKKRGVFKV